MREPALAIMNKAANGSTQKVAEALHLGQENTYVLQNKIQVYTSCFTAWTNGSGNAAFYDDFYK